MCVTTTGSKHNPITVRHVGVLCPLHCVYVCACVHVFLCHGACTVRLLCHVCTRLKYIFCGAILFLMPAMEQETPALGHSVWFVFFLFLLGTLPFPSNCLFPFSLPPFHASSMSSSFYFSLCSAYRKAEQKMYVHVAWLGFLFGWLSSATAFLCCRFLVCF